MGAIHHGVNSPSLTTHSLTCVRDCNRFCISSILLFLLLIVFCWKGECEAYHAVSSSCRSTTRRHRTLNKSETTALHVALSPLEHDAMLASFLLPATYFSIFHEATTNFVAAAAAAAATTDDATTASSSAIHLLDSYGDLLREYPLTTKMVTASILSTTGDAIAQYSTFRRKQKDEESDDTMMEFLYDKKRGIAFGLFGMLYTGGFQHYWFPYLTNHIADWGHNILHLWGSNNNEQQQYDMANLLFFHNGVLYDAPPSPLALAAGKVVLNQVIMIPGLYMPIFLLVTSLLGGLDLQQATARAQSLYFPLVQRNWFFWFPAQFIQFWAIPTEWHIPFLSMAGLIWTIILSTIGASSSASAGATAPVASAPVMNKLSNDEPLVLVQEVTGTDTITVVDVIQNALGQRSPTTLGVILMALAVFDNAFVDVVENVEESSASTSVTPNEVQILFIATAGLIGWTLGPKLGPTPTVTTPSSISRMEKNVEDEMGPPDHAIPIMLLSTSHGQLTNSIAIEMTEEEEQQQQTSDNSKIQTPNESSSSLS